MGDYNPNLHMTLPSGDKMDSYGTSYTKGRVKEQQSLVEVSGTDSYRIEQGLRVQFQLMCL